MARMREPVEFGFPTAPYLPPEHQRPLWRTMLFGALLSIIPLVGPGMAAVYVDRRDAPGTFAAAAALKTAVILFVSVALLALVAWIILSLILGFTVQLSPSLTRDGV